MAAKSKSPPTPSERTAASRAAKVASGYRQKAFLLPPAALRDLDAITKRDGCTEIEALTGALANFARPDRREPSDRDLIRMLEARLSKR
ncbi:hypothetical protein U91I_02729 [alpha proteobacterium U9-1i]|nr:hypothetical protein U91I_02729 [alpha proteobacterium U9-1i]